MPSKSNGSGAQFGRLFTNAETSMTYGGYKAAREALKARTGRDPAATNASAYSGPKRALGYYRRDLNFPRPIPHTLDDYSSDFRMTESA